MVLLQIDIPSDLDVKVNVYKAKNQLNKHDAVIKMLGEFLEDE